MMQLSPQFDGSRHQLGWIGMPAVRLKEKAPEPKLRGCIWHCEAATAVVA
jgi:hypothetical protein